MDLRQKVELFMSRFYGRQDVYGKQWEMVDKITGKTARGFTPVCDNISQPFCHIRLKDGVPCSKCEHKKWAPVGFDCVSKHILGEQTLLVYMLQQDGTIRFGAMDFDKKPGKEAEGYGFDEVIKVSNLLSKWGVKHYIARSTGCGYHLYIFFDRPYQAHRFRSFVYEIYAQVGFMQYVQQGTKPLPELFPKQSYLGRDGMGNGIKPPMLEPRFEKRRNGWVDRIDNFIGQDYPPNACIDAQWEYFANTEYQSIEELDRIIEEQGIEIIEESAPTDQGSPTSRRIYDRASTNTKWAQPLAGSIEKLLEGCAAFRKIRDKAKSGTVLGHDEGFALYHMCMHTIDGIGWFNKNVPGWGESDKDRHQLEHSITHNYSPWTCRTLQDKGVCRPGTQCFEKKPPKEIVDGVELIRNDLPRDKWPEPSPIRYAHGTGEDFLLKLKEEVTELLKEKNETIKVEKIKALTLRAQIFDDAQFKEFKAHVRETKLLKRNEITKIFNESMEDYTEDLKKKVNSLPNSAWVDDNNYIHDEYGYTLVKTNKNGKPQKIRLCSVDILIKEVRMYIEEEQLKETKYAGVVKTQGIEKKFEIPMAEWCDNSKFYLFFSSMLHSKFSPIRQNIEFIKQAALRFSEIEGIEVKTHLMTQGYYDDVYLMPSVIVEANSIKPNTTRAVDLSSHEASRLDFQILSEDEFRGVLMHIKTEFLTTWPKAWTYIGIPHTLTGGILEPMGWVKKHTLFYEGLTGGGKSELTHALQFFWGNFPSLANFLSSSKGIRELGYLFKDACIVIDDYKNLNKDQTAAVRETILHAYDSAIDVKLKRDGTTRAARAIRGIYIMSGEEFITHDAAVIARTILVETNKHRTIETGDKYIKVLKMRKYYSGVTAKFLAWFLTLNREELEDQRRGLALQLKNDFSDAQNIERVANNLSCNHLVWLLFTRFLVENHVASPAEKEHMDIEQWGYILQLRASMLKRCSEEQCSVAFLRILSQMINSKEVSVDDLSGAMIENRPVIGYVPPQSVGIINLFPDAVVEKVKSYSRNNPLNGTVGSIARQLEDQGVMAEKDKGHLTKSTTYNGRKIRVWSIKSSALGINLGELKKEEPSSNENLADVVPIRSGARAVSNKDDRKMF